MSRGSARKCSRTRNARSGRGPRCGSVRYDARSCGSRRSSSRRNASRLRAYGHRRRRSRRDRLRPRLLRCASFRGLCRFFSFFGSRQAAEMLAHQFSVLQVNRARVRLFFRDASFREVINQDFRLDLQFPRQLINPDLIGICHSPLFNRAGTRARAL
jgi:hypothetical protein